VGVHPDAHERAAGSSSLEADQEAAVEVIAQLESIVPSVIDIADRVKPDQFEEATPCANYKVRDLFTHMIAGASQFAPQLRGDAPVAPPEVLPLSDDERPAALRAALEDLLAAAKSPGALGQTVHAPFGAVPGEVLARFLTVDGMVHAWDIATATGQVYDPPEELAASVLATAHDLIAAEMRDGDTFAAETPVPDTAPAIVRLVAFTGRAVTG
jgi:uncharacterized protein (TIGR03086 family)